jgi:hypothetical protein
MGEAIMLLIIAIGVVLLLALQGLVLASMNKESEEIKDQPASGEKKSITAAINEMMKRGHDKEHRYKMS